MEEIPDTLTKALFDRYEKHQAKHVTPSVRIKSILKALEHLLPAQLKAIDRADDLSLYVELTGSSRGTQAVWNVGIAE